MVVLTAPAGVVHLHVLEGARAGVAEDGAVHGNVAEALVAASEGGWGGRSKVAFGEGPYRGGLLCLYVQCSV